MLKKRRVVVFDLDDTLYKEIGFLKSAYRHIASLVSNKNASENKVFQLLWNTYKQGGNAFDAVIKRYGFRLYTVQWMVDVYRNHKPHVSLDNDTLKTLEQLKTDGIVLGIISDGRFVQQMNKIEALGLKEYISEDDIVINTDAERIKPNVRSFRRFMERYGKGSEYWYVGDNTAKDFIAPNCLGWTTVCLLDDGKNIHQQNFNLSRKESLPKYKIKELGDLHKLICK